MLKNFRTYNLAVELYRQCKALKLNGAAVDQLDRASLSVVLNIAEATGKNSKKDQKRFYSISLGSLREVQAILDLHCINDHDNLTDQLGACLYVLSH